MTKAARTWTKIVAWLTVLAGAIMLVAGIVAWSVVSGELGSQKINVAEEGQKTHYASTPFDALNQISLIQEHTKGQMTRPADQGGFAFPEGTTYAMVPMPDAAQLAQCKATQAKDTVNGTTTLTDECKTLIKDDSARTYLDNSNFKQASLYMSVLAFGVSLLVVGAGIVFLLIGSAGIVITSKKNAAAAVASREDKSPVTV